jgi:hypothetical protein
LRIVNGAAAGSGQLVDALPIGPVQIIVGIPFINASIGSGRNGWRIRKISETSSRFLGGIKALAAFELGVVNCAAAGHGCFVDALANFEISIVGIPSIGSVDARGRNSRRTRKISETSSRRLASVSALAALELRIIDQAAGGLRQFVDALPISPVGQSQHTIHQLLHQGWERR